MPVIRLQRGELKRFGIDEERLIKEVSMLGADLKDYDSDEIRVEFFPDRPDLYTVEGVVRALRGFWGIERGAPKYSSKRSDVKLFVDEKMREIRPYIVGAVIKNVSVDDLMIKSMMDFQEKLHITVGRKRKKLAIGLHDFDKVKPPFRYVPKAKDFKFRPLGFKREMTLEEILKEHPKGIEYAHILNGLDEYPIILDSEDHVLSFPPIINGTLTQITEETENIFIDITGTDMNTLLSVLNIITCSLADRGASVESVEIIYPEHSFYTPKLEYSKIRVSKDYAKKILGIDLGDDQIKEALEKMRYNVEISGNNIEATVPPYRMDILHPVDVVEDIAKGYGYTNFELSLPTKEKIGSTSSELREKIQRIMNGLGFFEVTTLTITSPRMQYDMMLIPPESFVEIENPITEEGTILRSWLIPSLMEILRKNRHRDLPQKIFEIGYVVKERKELHLAFLHIDSEASFTLSKSYTEAILRDLEMDEYEIKEHDHGSFIGGRCASILVDREEIGFFGELHPQVLENFQLGYPVIAMEINLSKIKEKL